MQPKGKYLSCLFALQNYSMPSLASTSSWVQRGRRSSPRRGIF
ncbi:putative holin [Pseudomonas phage U47]|nr:putative holin [Pseudomonas phage U47]